MTLKNKTILITGAARRLGNATAVYLAQQGANLILHYNSSSAEVEVTKKAVIDLGSQCWTVQADLSNPADLSNLMKLAVSFSPLYGLINNASLFKPLTMEQTSLTEWENHLRVNLTAPFYLTQQFALAYNQPEVGRVINLVDWRALRPGKDHFPYTISKSALVALTKAAALSLAPGITVNAIALGAILPPENEVENPDLLKSIPLKRWAMIDEFLSAINFLLEGPEAITGEVVHLDGGRQLV